MRTGEQIDIREEATLRFSQFCERAYKLAFELSDVNKNYSS